MLHRLYSAICSLFSEKPIVIQLETQLLEISKDDDESIKTLAHHPGFIALHNRLRVQQALLKMKLETERNTHEDDNFLKSGIFWSKYYHQEVTRLVNKKDVPRSQAAPDDIRAEFEKMHAQLERVK